MTTEILGTITEVSDTEAQVAFERHYATDAADLWEAATTPERLARWFTTVSGDLTAGGTFIIHFDDGDALHCRVETCEPGRAFSWSWPHDHATSLIEVSVTPNGDGARLRLVHTRLTPASAPEYGAGWQAFIRSLDRHLGHPDAPTSDDWWEEFHTVKDGYAAALGT